MPTSSNLVLLNPPMTFSSLCVYVKHPSASLKRIYMVAFQTHSENPGQLPYLKIINLITPQRFFPNKVTFTGFKDQDQTWGHFSAYQKCIKKYQVSSTKYQERRARPWQWKPQNIIERNENKSKQMEGCIIFMNKRQYFKDINSL